MLDKISKLPNKVKDIVAEAFYLGTQGIPLAHFLNDVTALFERLRQETHRIHVENIKRLEAAKDLAQARFKEAKERWERMQEITGNRAPAFVIGALAVGVALLMMLGEGALLSPTMDGLGISEPVLQFMVASVMVAGFTLLLKWAVNAYHQTPRKQWQIIVPATFSLVSLAVFGYWRAQELMFSAAQKPDTPQFAADSWLATTLLMILVTIALPAGAAVALDWGLSRLRLWSEHRRARLDFLKYEKEATEKSKELEAAIETRDTQREELAQRREEWLSAMRDAY